MAIYSAKVVQKIQKYTFSESSITLHSKRHSYLLQLLHDVKSHAGFLDDSDGMFLELKYFVNNCA